MPVPSAAKKPTDHAAKAAKAEAKNEDIRFDFEGIEYVIPRDNADNIELYEFIEDEKNFKVARMFLGAEQWSAFKDRIRLPDGRVPSEPTERFLNALMGVLGEKPSASPTS